MEFLESQDPEKKKLIEASERHKRALGKGITELGDNTQKILTNALIVGGVLALSYLVVRGFSSGSKKKKKKRAKVTVVSPQVSTDSDDDDEIESGSPSLLADVGSKIANQATVILIDIARQKLMEYLDSRKKEE